jgi:hypothetical protein
VLEAALFGGRGPVDELSLEDVVEMVVRWSEEKVPNFRGVLRN